MNFYNPYMNVMPYVTAPARTGIFSRIFSGFSFRSLISGTQKTLNFINQAIPAIKNVSPIVKNAKTMFKVMNEFRKSDTTETKTNKVTNKVNNNLQKKEVNNQVNEKNNAPTFFI